MRLWINDSEASTSEIERGVAAAHAELSRRGVTVEAAQAAFAAAADDQDFNLAHLEAWEAAQTAALRAAFQGWQEWPEAAVMVAE